MSRLQAKTPEQWAAKPEAASTPACLGGFGNGSAARDPHGIKQITVGPPHGIKQITMFIRENVECLDSSFTTTTTIKGVGGLPPIEIHEEELGHYISKSSRKKGRPALNQPLHVSLQAAKYAQVYQKEVTGTPESILFMTPTTTSAEETDSETHKPTMAETPVITAAEKTMNITTNSSKKNLSKDYLEYPD
ncbi:hypothetical protein J6590_028495 [Homalodisca vitripennis]|nr:hypothetical protein J6590_028495 [Homalodisca vitripennis]